MSQIAQQAGSGSYVLLPTLAITAALPATAGTVFSIGAGAKYVAAQANFVYGSGGTTASVYVQTSFDNANWADIMEFDFATSSAIKISAVTWSTALAAAVAPSDGALTVNTILSGLIAPYLRVKYKSTGTYAGGTTLTVTCVTKG
jgi:hypothetical protein